jgi:error-prone DNA polymerase
LEKLADADAFRSIGLDRRQALWEIFAVSDRASGIFKGQPSEYEKQASLPVLTMSEHVLHDYKSMALSLKAHPVSFVRNRLNMLNILPSAELKDHADGISVKVAGLVLVRQRPGTASGICFITIEDETGTANLVVFKNLFDKFRKEILHSRLLMIEGKLQKEGEVIHVVARNCYDLSGLLSQLSHSGESSALQTLSRADEKDDRIDPRTQKKSQQKSQQLEMFPSGRNFR